MPSRSGRESRPAGRSPRLHLVGAVYAQPYSAGQADRLAAQDARQATD
ncbi:MAG: hypothetical protein IT330_13320 [Anaerolineae bacterium]|nr:hypothetical protein [Anaerolineae bacterium]